jgi:hypothetical protein
MDQPSQAEVVVRRDNSALNALLLMGAIMVLGLAGIAGMFLMLRS